MKTNTKTRNTITFGSASYLRTLLIVFVTATLMLTLAIPYSLSAWQYQALMSNKGELESYLSERYSESIDQELTGVNERIAQMSAEDEVFHFLLVNRDTTTGVVIKWGVTLVMAVLLLVGIAGYTFVICIPARDTYKQIKPYLAAKKAQKPERLKKKLFDFEKPTEAGGTEPQKQQV